jgi:hypothetical protein
LTIHDHASLHTNLLRFNKLCEPIAGCPDICIHVLRKKKGKRLLAVKYAYL